MSPARNLVNLNRVTKGFSTRTVLDGISLGISEGDRVGVVGGNGQGKSTLLALIAGAERPDEGAVIRLSDLRIGGLEQADELDRFADVRQALVGDRQEHEWAGDRSFRDVLGGLLGGTALSRFPAGMDTEVSGLSGGERRRIAIARLLLERPDLLLLDEPTNHLDVEAISWLAGHLAARSGAMLIVTHDRWFLDAVATQTWEVTDQAVEQYEGGYAAYVLARAERDRLRATQDERRRQLVRKELAWLRRGPPARTSKPKFRIDAANALIADEPAARNSVELLRFASSRLGDRVLEADEIAFGFDGQPLLRNLTLHIGPGDRLALVGANGSGKTTLLRLLAGQLPLSGGTLQRGSTVRLAYLSQHTEELSPNLTVLGSLEEIGKRVVLASGQELTAQKLTERFGFRGDRARTPVGALSGGERRRLALMRLLMGEPNVLLLDEPTNDLDIDTLTALEDLLDGWPGSLVVVSHDRYFVERVCDNVYALTSNGGIRHLPGGIEQYLRADGAAAQAAPPASQKPPVRGAELRAGRKEVARLEREVDRATERVQEVQRRMVEHAADHQKLGELDRELRAVTAERQQLESAWLEAAEALED